MLLCDLPINNKVKVGNYWHPAKDVATVCSKSVRRLVMKAVGCENYWGMRGSVTLVDWHGQCFGLFTRHQIKDVKFDNLPESFSENFMVPSLQPKFKNLSITSLRFPSSGADEEYYDIVTFLLNHKDKDVIREKPYFSRFLLGQKVTEGSWFYVGYPNLGESLVYSDEGDRVVEFKQSVLLRNCVPEEGYSGPKYLKRFSHETPQHLVDGLSGGAIFCLTKTQEGYEVALDSIITRANGNFMYGINSNFLDVLMRDQNKSD